MSDRRHVLTQQTAEPRPYPEYDLPVELDGTSWSVRANIVGIMRRELMGPSGGDDETLVGESPVTKYIVGRLAPRKLGADDIDDDSAGASGDALDVDGSASVFGATEPDGGEPAHPDALADDEGEDDIPQRRGLMAPSSMGLRFQVPRDLGAFTAHCRWAVYSPAPTGEVTSDGREIRGFAREGRDVAVEVVLSDLVCGKTKDYAVAPDVTLRADLYDDESGSRYLVELALCNDRDAEGKVPVADWMFQTQVEVEAGGNPAFLPVRDCTADWWVPSGDEEQRRVDLQYRDHLEYAVGRTCSVDWDEDRGARRATAVRTEWLPTAEVPQVSARTVEGAVLDMERLAEADARMVEHGLRPIVRAYSEWLDGQGAAAAKLPGYLRPVGEEAVEDARRVADRLKEGVDYLASHEDALACFRFMNRVMADQRVHSQVAAMRAEDPQLTPSEAEARVREGQYPHHWRAFQLAFVLLQVVSVMEPASSARSGAAADAQLIFFPTGGGKTEAYLGLAALTFAARRLRGDVGTPDGPLGSGGVAVLMRYTLRLLTSQQFQRASALVCAAELERCRRPETWGDEPFRLGLWVGSNVTPKRVSTVAEELRRANARGARGRLDALQLDRCPWCGCELGSGDVRVDEDAMRVLVHCHDATGECPFSEGGEVAEGLPVLTTDEEIYRLVPSFVIATVDKFARLAREGEASSLFGYVGRRCERHGFVPRLDASGKSDYAACKVADGSFHPAKGKHPKAYVRPCGRLRPPDLIIQDELHLITGSLGTTVGLFEVAVDSLCSWTDETGRPVRPLVVASSATMRNAADQIRRLYGRGTTVFPPQVLDASDTFFSQEVPPDAMHPGRLYVGVSASGTRLTAAEIQVAALLMKSAQLLFDRAGAPADPYMTLVGYFSATRELAGMARYMADDVTSILRRVRPDSGFHRRMGSLLSALNVGELTSRISSKEIVGTLGRMNVPFDPTYDTTDARYERIRARNAGEEAREMRHDSEAPYDAVLATSMLQVGVDVPRLGLMMVVGQPKNTAEYIQASSRVGRDARKPGLVVTLGNWSRPRDLAHYEQFRAYHESFYARVEPLSVTPFSATALERGAAGLLVSAARVTGANRPFGGMSPESAAARILDQEEGGTVRRLVEDVLMPRIAQAADEDDLIYARNALTNRLDAWDTAAESARKDGLALVYEKADASRERALIRPAESSATGGGFSVANSMREVQPEINILVSPDPARLRFNMADEPAWAERGSDGVTEEAQDEQE